jgi:hypothetical protein
MRQVVVIVLVVLLAAGCLGSSSSYRVDVTGVRVRSIAAAYPYSLAAGQGQIWVAEHSGVGLMDAAAGRVRLLARIPNSAEWYDLAYDSGSVWYMAPSSGVGVVYRVDGANGRVQGRQRFDGGPRRERTQTWHDIAAVTGRVCVGRLAARSREAVPCSSADLRHGCVPA